jgi:hypothetical protein
MGNGEEKSEGRISSYPLRSHKSSDHLLSSGRGSLVCTGLSSQIQYITKPSSEKVSLSTKK